MSVQGRLDELTDGMTKMQEHHKRLQEETERLEKAMLQQVGAITILKELLAEEEAESASE